MSVPISHQSAVQFAVLIRRSACSRADQSLVADAGVHLGPARGGGRGRADAGLRLGRASILFLGLAEDAPHAPFFGGPFIEGVGIKRTAPFRLTTPPCL